MNVQHVPLGVVGIYDVVKINIFLCLCVFFIIVVFMCVYYRLLGGMRHLKIETRLRDERL
jgi:hypothetical protein